MMRKSEKKIEKTKNEKKTERMKGRPHLRRRKRIHCKLREESCNYLTDNKLRFLHLMFLSVNFFLFKVM